MIPGAENEKVELKLPKAMSSCATESKRSALSELVPAFTTAVCGPTAAKFAVPPLLGKSGLLVQNEPTFHDPPIGPIHVSLTWARTGVDVRLAIAARSEERRVGKEC